MLVVSSPAMPTIFSCELIEFSNSSTIATIRSRYKKLSFLRPSLLLCCSTETTRRDHLLPPCFCYKDSNHQLFPLVYKIFAFATTNHRAQLQHCCFAPSPTSLLAAADAFKFARPQL